MTNPELQVAVRGNLIIITHPATQFFAIDAEPNNRSELVVKRRPDTGDNVLSSKFGRRQRPRRVSWGGLPDTRNPATRGGREPGSPAGRSAAECDLAEVSP